VSGLYAARRLLAILTAAILLRLVFLGRMSLWMDEGYTWHFSSARWGELFRSVAGGDNHPPLYYLLVSCFRIFGESEFILRLPAALFGVLTVLLTVRIGEKFVSRRAAFLAGIFTACSSFMLLFSRETRMYPMVGFLLLLNLYYLDAALARGGRRDWILHSLSLAAALYTHYLAFVFLLAQGIALAVGRRISREWLLSVLASAAVFLPWGIYFGLHWKGGYWGHEAPPPNALLEAFYSQAFGFTLYFSAVWQWLTLALASAGLFLLGCRPLKGGDVKYLFLPFAFLFFLLSTLALAAWTPVKIWEAKYLYVAAPFFWLTVARALDGFSAGWWRSATAAVLVLLNGVSFFNVLFHPEWGRQDNRQAAAWLLTRCRKGDPVLVLPSYQRYALEYYLRGVQVRLFPLGKKEVDEFSFPGDFMKTGRLFLVRGPWWLTDPRGRVREAISSRASLVDSMETMNRNASFVLSAEIYIPRQESR
jgi:uncharacterized membrane protein